MRWEQLLIQERPKQYAGQEKNKVGSSTDLRSEFEKDYHRIIGSASFRRLQDKTQVFPLDRSDFIRTRLTHSLEVASLGKSLGQTIGETIISQKIDSSFTARMKEDICHILECAGLIHDIGNPPFGHFGETAIREWFRKHLPELKCDGVFVKDRLSDQMICDFYNFEGNAQALRLVTKLHYLVDEYGMNLSYPLLNTIIKYPVSSVETNRASGHIKDKKMGYFYADRHTFREITEAVGTGGCRHPLTYILEAADDLAYKTADMEDGFVKGYVSYDLLYGALEKLERQWREEKGEEPPFAGIDTLCRLRSRGEQKTNKGEGYAVRNWLIRVQSYLIRCATEGFLRHYEQIMSGSYPYDLFHGGYGERIMKLLGELAFQYVFSSKDIYRMEVSEAVILDFLMGKFVGAVLDAGVDGKGFTTSNRWMAFISDNYKAAYHRQMEQDPQDDLYLRLLLVTDYICGMTDSYAKRFYQEMNGIL